MKKQSIELANGIRISGARIVNGTAAVHTWRNSNGQAYRAIRVSVSDRSSSRGNLRGETVNQAHAAGIAFGSEVPKC